MNRSPTIFEVAAHAGVPKSTVSLVLRSSPQIKPETTALVCRSMEEVRYVYVDGGRQAVRHLIQMGAHQIAFVGGLKGLPITEERMKGYVDEMRRTNIEPIILYRHPSRMTGARLAEELISNHPQVDAAICFNDLVALGVTARFSQKKALCWGVIFVSSALTISKKVRSLGPH